MEAEILYTQLVHDFKAGIHLVLGSLHGVSALIPGIGTCATAKLVAAGCTECMPPCHGKLQPIFHFLTHYDLFSIVIMEGQRIVAVLAFKLDFSDLWKILFCHILDCLIE